MLISLFAGAFLQSALLSLYQLPNMHTPEASDSSGFYRSNYQGAKSVWCCHSLGFYYYPVVSFSSDTFFIARYCFLIHVNGEGPDFKQKTQPFQKSKQNSSQESVFRFSRSRLILAGESVRTS